MLCLIIIIIYYYYFSNVWGLHFAIYLRRKNTNRNTGTWDMSTSSAIKLHQNTALLYTCQNRRMGCPKNEMPILWTMGVFLYLLVFSFFFIFFYIFFFLKRTAEKPFQRHANWLSPFDMVTLWSGWVLRARNRCTL